MKSLYTIIRTTEITDEMVSDWNRYQEIFTGIKMTNEQMLDIIKNDFKGGDNFLYEAATDEFETGMREQFMEMLSRKLIKKEWPCGCDMDLDEFRKFEQELMEAAKAAGYKVNDGELKSNGAPY